MDLIAKSALLAVAGCLQTAGALAQDYPTQPVRLISPGPPGSPSDIRARWVADKLAPALRQAVIVENKAGAGGNIGAETAAKSPADGYTLLLVHQGILAVNPHLYARTGFDALNDFAPVTRIVDSVLMLAVPPQSPARSVADLVSMAKAKKGALSFGSSGVGTPPHMAGELFKRVAGIDVVHVPYKGATPALMDLLGGRLAFTIDGLSSQAPQVKAGKLRALAVTSRERLPSFPDIPTLAESGYPQYEYRAWMGIVAPARTPREIILRLNAELVAALRTREAREWFDAQGGMPIGDSPEQFAAYIREEHARFGAIVRETGIRAD